MLRILGRLCFSATMKEQRVPLLRSEEVLPFKLNLLWDNEGARHTAKRLGRGNGSGKGNSCGKGMRGQKSRASPGVTPKMEGGQNPLQKRFPQWGNNPNPEQLQIVNMNQILYAIWQGRIDPTQPITIKSLYDARLFRRTRYGVKVLARGVEQLDMPINLEVSDASASVISAIKEKGGSVKCIYRTPLKVREHLYPERYDLELKDPLPPSYALKQLNRIEARGAEVAFREPNWLKAKSLPPPQTQEKAVEKVDNVDQLKKEKKKKKQEVAPLEDEFKNFVYPAPHTPGIGDTKIRKRKPILYKTVEFKQ